MRVSMICRTAAAFCVVLAMAACSDGGPSTTARTTSTTAPSHRHGIGVDATRVPLTTDANSAVAHDTETLALVPHAGRLFAATGQWMYGGTGASGQVLVKDSANGPWTVFERTSSLRVQALRSFAVPDHQGIGAGHSLLVTQAIVGDRSVVQWLLDDAPSFAPDDSFALASPRAAARAFGAHEDHGVWSVYAGVAPTGILRGTWSPRAHTLVFDPTPELAAAPPAKPGQKTQKVTAFADCGGALFVTVNTKLYRRNDGDLPAGTARWQLVYEAPPVGQFNSGLRGLTCVTHDGAPSLLVSTEGSGDVSRFDQLRATATLTPVHEFSPAPAIRTMLAATGTNVPSTGSGSIGYVIAAYNDFTPLSTRSPAQQAFGFEWAYLGDCAPNRECGPKAFNAVTFDAAACFAVRTDRAPAPEYTLRCLRGADFDPPGATEPPIRNGQAFVSIRTIAPSPFGDDRLFYGGYDCNFFPADGTAWTATSTLAAAGL